MSDSNTFRFRSNSIQSIKSFNNIRRIVRTVRNNEALWNMAMESLTPRSGRRTPVIIINQIEKPSLMTNLFQHKFLCAGTTLYALLWIVLAICCLIQSFDRLSHFIFNPTTIDLVFYENVTITPPSITICTYDLRHNKNPVIWPPYLTPAVGNVSYSDAYDLLRKTDIGIDDLWNISRFTVKDLEYSVVQANLWSRYQHYYTIEERDTFTVNGICSTFIPKGQIPCIGALSGIRLKSDKEVGAKNDKFLLYTFDQNSCPLAFHEGRISGEQNHTTLWFSVLFHNEEELPVIRYYGTLGSGVHLPFKKHINIALRIRQITNLDSWNDPCDSLDVVANCVARCIESNILLKSNLAKQCRLPYMEERHYIPVCQTAEQFHAIYIATEDVLKNLNVETDCGCHKSCKSTVYTADHFFMEPTEHTFDVLVNFPDCEIELVQEVKNYGVTAFLADIGGSLGLFLGISLLSLHDIGVKLMKRKKEGKPLCC